jgi:indole-3-glycerol phosphate synthase
VLTDEKYFGGKLEYLAEIAHTLRTDDFSRRPVINELVTTQPPLLCKDFIFDEYQILEARAAGAGAALLIAAMLAPASLARLIRAARSLRLTPLVEVHTQEEASLAVDAGADVIGINNRDLHTFRVDLDTTLQLRPLIPPEIIVVAESGIKTAADVQMLADANVDAMLIGEGLVTAEDPAAKAREFSRTEDGRRETETSAAGLPSPVKL